MSYWFCDSDEAKAIKGCPFTLSDVPFFVVFFFFYPHSTVCLYFSGDDVVGNDPLALINCATWHHHENNYLLFQPRKETWGKALVLQTEWHLGWPPAQSPSLQPQPSFCSPACSVLGSVISCAPDFYPPTNSGFQTSLGALLFCDPQYSNGPLCGCIEQNLFPFQPVIELYSAHCTVQRAGRVGRGMGGGGLRNIAWPNFDISLRWIISWPSLISLWVIVRFPPKSSPAC